MLISDFMRKKLDIVKIVKGNACTIRAFGSDVILHTPEGLHAVVLGNIHVNHAQFQHLVPANECIVGPICEYSIHALIYSPALQPGAKYKLQIPHVIRDIEEVKHHIRVRHGNIHGDAHNLKLGPELLQSNNAEEWYEVDNHFITIYTSNFSGYIVTVEGINCCSGSANLLLFGSLTNAPDEEPLATLKVYMSSAHSTQIRDYRTVGLFAKVFLFVIFCSCVSQLHVGLKFIFVSGHIRQFMGFSRLNLISLLLAFIQN